MEIPIYLAMTGAEAAGISAMPPNIAWLSCLFSPYSTGLSNLPKALPPGAMVILSDRTPIYGHDPGQILSQLERVMQAFSCCGVLLDFQARDDPALEGLAGTLQALPCPVAVTEQYAKHLSCPVFLPPVPLDQTPEQWLSPWQGREIWLETAPDTLTLEVTERGVTRKGHLCTEQAAPFYDEVLCCHYGIACSDCITFHLRREKGDLENLLQQAKEFGVTKAVGLYQELG